MIEHTPRGFFSALYDLSFHSFVTPKIIRVLYILALVIIGLWSLGFLISGFTPSYSFVGTSQPSATSMLVHIIGAPIMFVIGSILARVYLEFIIAVFNIAENTRKA
jgi:hypothetical protein